MARPPKKSAARRPRGKPSGTPKGAGAKRTGRGKPGAQASGPAKATGGKPPRKRPAASSQRKASPQPRTSTVAGERLQKVLAMAGYGSRRQCEELILEGRVEVDRQVVTELGTRVDQTKQKVSVDGEQLAKPRYRYFAVNKPRGVISTSSDPAGRERVIDLVPDAQRVFTVGRLDKSSEGLILVTNDGDLANQLTHPRYGVEKTYLVRVAGCPTPEELAQLRRGVHLAEGKAHVARIRIKSKQKNGTVLEMVLNEGRNREIRRVLAAFGHKVLKLQRVAIGPLRLGDMPAGAHRELSRDELKRLRRAVPGYRE